MEGREVEVCRWEEEKRKVGWFQRCRVEGGWQWQAVVWSVICSVERWRTSKGAS